MNALNVLDYISNAAASSNASFSKGAALAPKLEQVKEGSDLLQNFANTHGIKMAIYLGIALSICEAIVSGILLVPLVESFGKDFALSFTIAMAMYFVLLYSLSMITGKFLYEKNPHLVELNNKLEAITNPEAVFSLQGNANEKSNKHLIIGGLAGLSFVILMGLLASFRNFMANGHSGELFNSPDDVFLFVLPIVLACALIYLSKWKGVYGRMRSFSKQVSRMTNELNGHKENSIIYGQKLLSFVRKAQNSGLPLPTDADTRIALTRMENKSSTDPDFFSDILSQTLKVTTVSKGKVCSDVMLHGCTANGVQLHTRSDANGVATFTFKSSPKDAYLVYIKTTEGVSLSGSRFECGQQIFFDVNHALSIQKESEMPLNTSVTDNNEMTTKQLLNELNGLPVITNNGKKFDS